jgi:hypothetical protein
VTDNGMLCFDQGLSEANARGKRDCQKLPHYDLVPPYTLFPFWMDLYIAQGKPHGIFFEISGAEGTRTLTVEWLVTTPHKELEHNYHFTVQLEESKPNIVIFKYYDTLDNGETCTIGVQGKGESSKHSHPLKRNLFLFSNLSKV